MNIHTISKGVVLYFLLLFVSLSVLIFNEFVMTEKTFTLFLIIGMIFISFYAGKNTKEYPTLNGFLIGLVTAIFLIFFLSSYTDMNWELNFMILVCWVSISTIGAFIGGKLRKFGDSIIPTLEKK